MSQTMQRTRAPKPVRKRSKVTLPWPLNLWQTAIGRKWVMALTGVGLLGFVLAHMIGNLHLYEGPLATYEYAEVLREIGLPIIPHKVFLWILRAGLLVMFPLHIIAARSLQDMSRKANPKSNLVSSNKQYSGGQEFIAANFASRTMRWTGPIILLYLIYHLMDLTWGWVNPDFVAGDPYHNVVASLSNLPVAIIYIIANLALGLHVFHGAWSLFQSLGINSPKINNFRRQFAGALAAIIVIGNLSFPIMVQAGVIDDDGRDVFESGEVEAHGEHSS